MTKVGSDVVKRALIFAGQATLTTPHATPVPNMGLLDESVAVPLHGSAAIDGASYP